MRLSFCAAAAAAMAAAAFCHTASAACYVVYGPGDEIVYRAVEPPVDMSRPLHETLPLVAPGGQMVFSASNDGCELEINKLPLAWATPVPPPTPTQGPVRTPRPARKP